MTTVLKSPLAQIAVQARISISTIPCILIREGGKNDTDGLSPFLGDLVLT